MKKNSISLLESWRIKEYKQIVGRPEAPGKEALEQELSKLGLRFEIVLELAAQAFYEYAEEANPQPDYEEYGDGAEYFNVNVFLNDEYDLETKYDLELNGKGTAWVEKEGSSGDYFNPPTYDEISYEVNDAMLTVYDNDKEIAKYNIKPYIDTSFRP